MYLLLCMTVVAQTRSTSLNELTVTTVKNGHTTSTVLSLFITRSVELTIPIQIFFLMITEGVRPLSELSLIY